MKESYEDNVADHESVDTFQWTRSRDPGAESVAWSRVRYRGFSVLSVKAQSGSAPPLKVSALASGERIDHFEVRRGG